MSNLEYQTFDLLIEALPGGYRARVTASPQGQAYADFTLPFTATELAAFALTAGRDLRQLRPPEAALPTAAPLDVKTFGARLFDEAFGGEVGKLLQRCLDDVERQGRGLRIRLHVDDQAPELAALPWECLYRADQDCFLALSEQTPLVRYMDLPLREPSLQVTLPLRILAVIASPGDAPPLQVEQEWERLRSALAGLEQRNLVQVERLTPATLAQLQVQLGQAESHILHFIGHGCFDPQTGQGGLLFTGDLGAGDLVTADQLAMLLHDHTALRLAFLNACEGAHSGTADAFAGVAQHLVRQQIPAVIAMQTRIGDSAAIALAYQFYAALAAGSPVDAALTAARKAIFKPDNDCEWATPALFSRAPDNQLLIISPKSEKPARQEQHIVQINSGGGAIVQGNVNVGGDFVGHDQITVVVQTPDEAAQVQTRLRLREELLSGDFVRKPFEPDTVLVPAGPFLMGSDGPDDQEWEKPRHSVDLPDYRIGKHPVTNAQYLAFVQAKRTLVTPEMGWVLAPIGQTPPTGKEDHPVVGVSWDEAMDYCRWLSQRTGRTYRLPGEAEWEKAAAWAPAQASQPVAPRRYPWGNTWDATRCQIGATETAAVTAHPEGASAYGCQDMAGNVWEWTNTQWGRERPVAEYSYPYRADDGREQPEPATGLHRELRICRGGSFQDGPQQLACSTRARFAADSRHPARGFRVAMEVG